MSEFTKEKLVAMRKKLGLGHKGDIIITTPERVNKNQPMIAKDIISTDYAEEILLRWNSFDDLYEACKAWLKVESEMSDNNPCPDLALRATYRKEATRLTKAALSKAKAP